jgi:alpha-glucosidase/lysosomal alpha-glucosidase
MNEPTNFCDGECSWTRKMEDDDIVEVFKNEKIMLPYVPGETRLDKMSLRYIIILFNILAIHLKHYGELLHKDVHNLYGL